MSQEKLQTMIVQILGSKRGVLWDFYQVPLVITEIVVGETELS